MRKCDHPDHNTNRQFGIECAGCGQQNVFGRVYETTASELRAARRLRDTR